LFDYVIEKDYLDEAEATYYMMQILEGLAYVHKKSIVHLDMKVQRGAESGEWLCGANTKHIVSELQRLVLLQHQVSPSIGEGEGSEGKEKGVKSADLGVANW